MNKRKQQSAFANPVLIGAVTVPSRWSAYSWLTTPTRGCRSSPLRELKVDIANGSELVAGSDVPGAPLIGLGSSLKPVTSGRTAGPARS